MKAVVSGRACVAVLIDGDTHHSIHYDDMDQLVPRQPEELSLLLGGVRDLDWLDDVVSADEVRDRLVDAVDETEALDLALYLCDDRLSLATHQAAAEEFNDLVAYPEIAEALEKIFFARPLPESTDLRPGLNVCVANHYDHAEAFLLKLLDHQPAIHSVRLAWEAVPRERFETESVKQVEAACVRHGVFRELVLEFAETENVLKAQMRFSSEPRMRHEIPTITGILNDWTRLIRGSSTSPKASTRDWAREDEYDEQPMEKGKHHRRKSIDRAKTLEIVQHQKERILTAMRQSEIERVLQLVDQLVDYQRRSGGAKFACLSLCDLAIEAQELNLFELQCALTKQSTQLKADDGWSWSQYGKALLNLGRFQDSLAAYGQSIDFSRTPAGNAVARTGRAEVLKAMGGLEGALAEYDAVRADHPNNVIARTGRAEVLKAMGDLEEALAEYDAVRANYPNDVIARTGREEILKAMGDLEGALAEYDAVRTEYSFDAVARNGRATMLSIMSRWDEALADLPDSRLSTRSDWIGFHIRGMTLLRSGRTDEAISIFEIGVRDCPFQNDVDIFRTALVAARFRQGRYGDALDIVSRIAGRAAQPMANVLRVHVYGELQDFERAKIAKGLWQSPSNPWDAETFQELERRYILQLPPAHDDDWLIDSEIRFLMQSA